MSKHYWTGWDYFTPPPGKVDSMTCRVCGSNMNLKRNVNGPTGWAESVGGGKHLHDTFSCSFAGEKWHDQALRLKKLAEETPSFEIQKIYEKEADEIIETRTPTK